MSDALRQLARSAPAELVGSDTLPELLAVLSRAAALVSPDSGPVHMATLAGTPVIGLYAATRVQRSGPYHSRQWCVDAYAYAARKFLGKSASEIPWTRKIEHEGVMDLISVDQVVAQLDRLLSARQVSAA